ncbi:putative secreted protein [Aequitasia blattaphilus]|uniref:DUF523 domain-containing protein n=1 Tax=Aequitasia blattaphilus TaxID=2949332 RepID=A0ABT1E890_9FIRM|nr:CD3072 family TudS-related putative desulfidase [Aequitasia blattaphilus]MCP1101829.1 hypothetical protein [Aequitasia blattaphilus]MCR8614469.1 hypothetical protein [Aequitasia blattaphilus]
MKRSNKIVLVSHCILNPNAKVHGLVDFTMQHSIVKDLLDMNIGIIQLPCVEQDMCGIRRWGQVVEQLDFPNFKNRCRELLTPILNQVVDFYEHNYHLLGVIGMDGSPTCGVHYTCSGDWYGEIGENFNLTNKIKSLHYQNRPGVMIQVLQKMLSDARLTIPFYALDEENLGRSQEKIIKQIKGELE